MALLKPLTPTKTLCHWQRGLEPCATQNPAGEFSHEGDPMHPDLRIVIWPDYQEFYRWLCQEVDGLTDAELDFDSHDPAQEWMWWSIRRQVSHMAWDLLIVMYRRCHMFLWPDGNVPTPIRWEDHRLGSMKYDRVLDERLFWRLEVLLDKVKLGVDWATQVVTTVPVETLRATTSRHRGTPFWRHVIQVLPRVGYLTLPEYTGEAASPGPSFVPLR